jgi:putative IMPACT (imprinted ancient) family translation regulator
VSSREDVDFFIKKLKQEKYFSKATHNTYAFRFRESSGAIVEGKNDDGETGV